MAPTAASDSVFDLNRDLRVLGEFIAEHGIEAVARSGRLDPVVRAARRAGAFATLVGIIVDENAPPVARERAFGHLATQLTALRSSTQQAVAA